jgi:hypothetical protein
MRAGDCRFQVAEECAPSNKLKTGAVARPAFPLPGLALRQCIHPFATGLSRGSKLGEHSLRHVGCHTQQEYSCLQTPHEHRYRVALFGYRLVFSSAFRRTLVLSRSESLLARVFLEQAASFRGRYLTAYHMIDIMYSTLLYMYCNTHCN